MTPESPLLDLLVVNGLTIDRFPDGSSAPGGPGLHIVRAAAPRGLGIGVITAAGPEPEARAGLDELRRSAALVESTPGKVTTTFRHRESAKGRRLWLERRGQAVDFEAAAHDRIRTRAILFAPVAGEIPTDALEERGLAWEPERGAILQGWLRTTDKSREVRPTRLSALDGALVAALSEFDLLVASREDLLAEADNPYDQVRSLREVFGRGPTLIVTDGPEGIWIGSAHRWRIFAPRHLPVPWRVEGVSTVGSGDIFAAFLLMGRRLKAPMRVVAEVLEERRGSAAES